MPTRTLLSPPLPFIRRGTTLAETLVVVAVIVVAGSVILGIGSAVWKILKSWQ